MSDPEIVLLGAGHTHAHVLREWGARPIAGAGLTCISDFPEAAYSGMLPGTLAGLYAPERMRIDLRRLCGAAGARLVVGETTGIDLALKQVLLAGQPPVPFDVLSIGIGSVPDLSGVEISGDALTPIKPMQTLLERFDRKVEALRANGRPGPDARGRGGDAVRPLRVAVVGGGAGGVEIAFCVLPRLHRLLGPDPFKLTLVEAQDRLLPGMPARTAGMAEHLLRDRGVTVLLGRTVSAVRGPLLGLGNGEQRTVDLVLWAIGARGPDLLRTVDLPKDGRGFLLTRPTLQTTASAPVFVVGDSGTLADGPAPKAGVHAVRQGPVLWENLGRFVRGETLRDYAPQRDFLRLLATGDRRAILVYRGMTLSGRWCWRLKNFIDGRFVRKYQA